MLQTGCDGNFPEKALRAECDPELMAQELESDQAIMLQIAGEVNDGHPTAAQLALQAIAVAEGCLN